MTVTVLKSDTVCVFIGVYDQLSFLQVSQASVHGSTGSAPRVNHASSWSPETSCGGPPPGDHLACCCPRPPPLITAHSSPLSHKTPPLWWRHAADFGGSASQRSNSWGRQLHANTQKCWIKRRSNDVVFMFGGGAAHCTCSHIILHLIQSDSKAQPVWREVRCTTLWYLIGKYRWTLLPFVVPWLH